MRVPNCIECVPVSLSPDDANSARRTVHPLWSVVRSAALLLGDPALAARVQAKLIRLGMGGATIVDDPPPA
jgi:hypothetical protein